MARKVDKIPKFILQEIADLNFTYGAATIAAKTLGYAMVSEAEYDAMRNKTAKPVTKKDLKDDWETNLRQKAEEAARRVKQFVGESDYPPAQIYFTVALLFHTYANYVYFDYTPLSFVDSGKEVSENLSESWFSQLFMEGTQIYDVLDVVNDVAEILDFIEQHVGDIDESYKGISLRNIMRLEGEVAMMTGYNYDREGFSRVKAMMEAY